MIKDSYNPYNYSFKFFTFHVLFEQNIFSTEKYSAKSYKTCKSS